jgi:hypothetical protein
LQQQAGVLEHAQVARRRWPRVRKPTGDLPCSGWTTQVNGQQDLSPRRMRQRGDDRIQRR